MVHQGSASSPTLQVRPNGDHREVEGAVSGYLRPIEQDGGQALPIVGVLDQTRGAVVVWPEDTLTEKGSLVASEHAGGYDEVDDAKAVLWRHNTQHCRLRSPARNKESHVGSATSPSST